VGCCGMLWSCGVVECCGVLWSCCVVLWKNGVLWSVAECYEVLWSDMDCCGVLWSVV